MPYKNNKFLLLTFCTGHNLQSNFDLIAAKTQIHLNLTQCDRISDLQCKLFHKYAILNDPEHTIPQPHSFWKICIFLLTSKLAGIYYNILKGIPIPVTCKINTSIGRTSCLLKGAFKS